MSLQYHILLNIWFSCRKQSETEKDAQLYEEIIINVQILNRNKENYGEI